MKFLLRANLRDTKMADTESDSGNYHQHQQQQQPPPRLERKRVPLSEQPVGEMKIDRSIHLYREDIVRNGKARLEAVRETTEAKDIIQRIYNAPDFSQVDSPWTCSRSRQPDRDPTPNKVMANKDTTVGTRLDIEGMRHYRTKLSDIWTAAYNNELEEVNLYLSCGADPNARNSMVSLLEVWVRGCCGKCPPSPPPPHQCYGLEINNAANSSSWAAASHSPLHSSFWVVVVVVWT